jgi:succinyl-CoA synthetase beta subunit
VVVKSQILAGGRGLGSFTNGLKGGVHILPAAQAPELAKKMLGGTLVTKQTGPAGKPVNVL